MPQPSADPRQNRLLASLPAAELDQLRPVLDLVALPLGRVVYEAGRAQSYVYFPTTAIVSMLNVMTDGAAV